MHHPKDFSPRIQQSEDSVARPHTKDDRLLSVTICCLWLSDKLHLSSVNISAPGAQKPDLELYKASRSFSSHRATVKSTSRAHICRQEPTAHLAMFPGKCGRDARSDCWRPSQSTLPTGKQPFRQTSRMKKSSTCLLENSS